MLEAEGGSILIDSARELRRDLYMRPFEAARRVYMILEAHLLRTESANALLKSLEEPPSYAVFLLVSDHADVMLPTIRSRVTPIPFRRLSTAQLAELTGDPVAARAALGDADRAQRLATDPDAAERRRGYVALARASLIDPAFDPGVAAKAIADAAAARPRPQASVSSRRPPSSSRASRTRGSERRLRSASTSGPSAPPAEPRPRRCATPSTRSASGTAT